MNKQRLINLLNAVADCEVAPIDAVNKILNEASNERLSVSDNENAKKFYFNKYVKCPNCGDTFHLYAEDVYEE